MEVRRSHTQPPGGSGIENRYILVFLWGEQRPFQRKGIEFVLTTNHWWVYNPRTKRPRHPLRFMVEVIWGPGAGYIHGWTLFVAFRSAMLRWWRNNRGDQRPDGKRYSWLTRHTEIQVGWTRNGNLVPYV